MNENHQLNTCTRIGREDFSELLDGQMRVSELLSSLFTQGKVDSKCGSLPLMDVVNQSTPSASAATMGTTRS